MKRKRINESNYLFVIKLTSKSYLIDQSALTVGSAFKSGKMSGERKKEAFSRLSLINTQRLIGWDMLPALFD